MQNWKLKHIKKRLGRKLWKSLRPYQRKGVSFLEYKNGRALLADDMGLGKTLQVLAWLRLHPKKKAVVVMPAVVKWKWKDEVEKWTPERKVEVLSSRTPHRIKLSKNLLLINYDILHDWINEIKIWGPDVLVVDEAHYIKNGKTKRTKAVYKLHHLCEHFIPLTGTPVVNAPVEFFQILKRLDPTLFPSFWKYAHRYCAAKHNGFGWDFKGASNEEELHEKISKEKRLMIRRLKEEVQDQMPDIVKTVLPLKLNSKSYDIALSDFKKNVFKKDKTTANILAEISELRQNTLQMKLPMVAQWLEDFLEDGDQKIVVFGHHKIGINFLMDHFGKLAIRIDGSVPVKKRHEDVQRFNTDPKIRMVAGNLKAAGVGIDLIGASNVLFIELPWSPADLKQATDRINRIGQTAKTIFVYYMLVKDSIEMDMMDLIDSKAKVLSQVLDGKQIEKQDLLKTLLKRYRKGN